MDGKLGRIISIVTVYFPDYEHVENVKNIMMQSDIVIICDNSPENHHDMFLDLPKTKYLFWNKNLGLSSTFNRVLKCEDFSWKDEDYIIFFDQDSKVENRHIYKLIKEYNYLKKLGYPIGCLGPTYFNTSSHKIEKPRIYKKITKDSIEVSSIMTSSMLCKYGDLKNIGFWNDEIFLDLADWDICWRFQARGMLCIMTNVSVLNHTLGEGEKRIGPIRLKRGKPVREYYQIRDCLYLLYKTYTPLKYKIRFIAMCTIRPLLHICFLDESRKRFAYIKQGFIDYRHNVHGELKENKEEK